MPAIQPHSQLRRAVADKDAEHAGFALLLAAAKALQNGKDLPKWAPSVLSDLISLQRARVMYNRKLRDGDAELDPKTPKGRAAALVAFTGGAS